VKAARYWRDRCVACKKVMPSLASLPWTRHTRCLLDPVMPLVNRAEKNATVVLAQKKALTQAGPAAQALLRQTAPLMEAAQAIATLKAQHGAAATEVLVAGQLGDAGAAHGQRPVPSFWDSMVSARRRLIPCAKTSTPLFAGQRLLLDGRADLGLTASTDVQVREKLLVLIKLFEDSKVQAQMLLTSLPGLTVARAAQVAILADSESVRLHLDELQLALSRQGTWSPVVLAVLVLALLLALASAAALAYVVLLDSRQRQALAESLQTEAQIREQEARALEQEARRVNAANQAAILRLMNELQLVAEGDLTQQATVTEDITGAIADSVNYTVEELRSLVGNVQSTVAKVAQTTSDVDETSTELLAASNEQLHEIRETGRSVVDMAGSHQPGVRAGAGVGGGGAAVLASGGNRIASGTKRHWRHEYPARPDSGHRQANQTAGRVVPGNW
jgi:twitching motility protein PilJ